MRIRQRRVTIIPMAGMGHTGRGGYIDFKPSDGTMIPNGQITAQTIADIITHAVDGHPIVASRMTPAAIEQAAPAA